MSTMKCNAILVSTVTALLAFTAGCADGDGGGSAEMPGMADGGPAGAAVAEPETLEGMETMEGMNDGTGGDVRLESGEAERIGLRWATAEVGPLVRTIRTAAVVEYPESEMEWVSPKVGGWVEKLHVNFEGAPVRRGQALLEIYSPELVTAQEELLLARRLDESLAAGRPANEARAEGSREDLLETARRRLSFWDISDAQIERLLETGEVRKTLTLHSPATGIVMEKRVFEGQGIKPGENLLMIAPTDRVWIEAAVYEQDLPFVREGQAADVTVQGLPGRTFSGRVSYVYPALRESSRTVVARIEVPNPDGELRPGMYATAQIANVADTVLSIPSSAVLHTGVEDVVFVRTGDDRLRPTIVQTGREGDERIEVLGGLEPGAMVAASAQFLLDSEANLGEAMQAMMAQMGRSGSGDMEGMDMGGDGEMEGMEDDPGGMGDTEDGMGDMEDSTGGRNR